MIFGVLAAVFACVTYGTSSVMQAYGANRSRDRAIASGDTGIDTDAGGPTLRSTIAAMLTVAFIVGTVLDVCGFFGNAVAARLAPLFLTQTIVSANLVITAVLGIFVLNIRLHARDWVAIAVVIGSLAALGVAADSEGHGGTAAIYHWGLLAASIAVVLLSVALIRRLGSRGAIMAGLTAGLLFGGVAIAVRILRGVTEFDVLAMLSDPAAYALAVAGVGGFYLHTVALQLGSVNGATAALVVGETVVPGIVGVVWLGDRSVPGLGWLAVAGFVLAVAGAVAVAWSGAAEAGAQAEAGEAKPATV